MIAEQRRPLPFVTEEAKLTNRNHQTKNAVTVILFIFWPSSTAARTADYDMLGPTARLMPSETVQHGNLIPCGPI